MSRFEAIEARARLRDRIRGRSLKVPDGNGGYEDIRVNTLKPSVLPPRKRTVFFVGDYNDTDARSRVKQVLAREIPARKHRETVDVDVDRYATLAAGYELAVLGVYTDYPDETIIYENVAPRGADNGDGNHRDIQWNGEKRQGLVFAVTDRGVPILGVNSGYAFSLVKDHLTRLWEVANISHDETQFRSLKTFPAGFAIMKGGRRGREFLGRELNPDEAIPDPPRPQIDQKGRLSANLLFVDGRESVDGGYHNQKILLTRPELPAYIAQSEQLWVTINGITRPVKNTLAGRHIKPDTGDFFLTQGSSGDPNTPWLEVNQLYRPAADAFGVKAVNDNIKVTFERG